MKSMAMVVGTLMVSVACAATGHAQPVADVAASSVTAATNSPAVANEASDVKDPNKIRCERMAVTGSRLGGKVCHTEADWARIEQRSDELVRDINSQFVAPPDPFRHTADYVPNPMGGG